MVIFSQVGIKVDKLLKEILWQFLTHVGSASVGQVISSEEPLTPSL